MCCFLSLLFISQPDIWVSFHAKHTWGRPVLNHFLWEDACKRPHKGSGWNDSLACLINNKRDGQNASAVSGMYICQTHLKVKFGTDLPWRGGTRLVRFFTVKKLHNLVWKFSTWPKSLLFIVIVIFHSKVPPAKTGVLSLCTAASWRVSIELGMLLI